MREGLGWSGAKAWGRASHIVTHCKAPDVADEARLGTRLHPFRKFWLSPANYQDAHKIGLDFGERQRHGFFDGIKQQQRYAQPSPTFPLCLVQSAAGETTFSPVSSPTSISLSSPPRQAPVD